MKSYDLKRAKVTILKRTKVKVDKAPFRNIRMHQAEIKRLREQGRAHDHPDMRGYRAAIKELRYNAKQFNNEKIIFEVFVKQYKSVVSIEWYFQHCPLGPLYREAFQNMILEVIKQAIQVSRARIKPYTGSDRIGNFTSEFCGDKKKGRVFAKAGEILRIYVEKNIKSLYTDKTPVEPKKYIGIELEFCAPIKENEFAIKLFKSGIHKFAQLKKDASLRPLDNEVGYELAILLEENNYKKRFKQITDLLTQVGAVSQDRRAGLHVHIDMRKRNKDLVYNNLVACQYALLSVVDPKRIDNEFCRIVESRKFPTEFTGQREERYRTINAAAFYKYKTLEIRMHEGSIDYTQITNWVDLLVRVANYSKKLKNDVTKVTTLGKRISLDKRLLGYIQDRSCFWQVRNGDNTQRLRNRMADLEAHTVRLGGIPRAEAPPPREEHPGERLLRRIQETNAAEGAIQRAATAAGNFLLTDEAAAMPEFLTTPAAMALTNDRTTATVNTATPIFTTNPWGAVTHVPVEDLIDNGFEDNEMDTEE